MNAWSFLAFFKDSFHSYQKEQIHLSPSLETANVPRPPVAVIVDLNEVCGCCEKWTRLSAGNWTDPPWTATIPEIVTTLLLYLFLLTFTIQQLPQFRLTLLELASVATVTDLPPSDWSSMWTTDGSFLQKEPYWDGEPEHLESLFLGLSQEQLCLPQQEVDSWIDNKLQTAKAICWEASTNLSLTLPTSTSVKAKDSDQRISCCVVQSILSTTLPSDSQSVSQRNCCSWY